MPVYFAQTPTGSIKIGCSGDIEARLDQLASHYGAELTLLATMPGGPKREAEIHKRFAHLRLAGRGKGMPIEQFRPGADLMQFIGRPLLVGPNRGTGIRAMCVPVLTLEEPFPKD